MGEVSPTLLVFKNRFDKGYVLARRRLDGTRYCKGTGTIPGLGRSRARTVGGKAFDAIGALLPQQ